MDEKISKVQYSIKELDELDMENELTENEKLIKQIQYYEELN
jgi:hypothetical protein